MIPLILLLLAASSVVGAGAVTVVISPVGDPYDKLILGDESAGTGLPGTEGEIEADGLRGVTDLQEVQIVVAKFLSDDAREVTFSRVRATEAEWYGETDDETDIIGVAKFVLFPGLYGELDGIRRVVGVALLSDYAYKIRTLPDGTAVAAKISQDDFFLEAEPTCLDGAMSCTAEDETGETSKEGTDINGEDALEKMMSQDDPIDIMIAYTYRAMCADAGLPSGCPITDENKLAIEETATLSVDFANEVYNTTGIGGHMRLVHTYMVDEGYDDAEPRTYQTMLNEITSTSDGVLDEVHTLRDEYAADLVSLLAENNQYCGLAHVYQVSPEAGFSVVQRECSAAYLTLAHETGHNIGVMHNREDTSYERQFAHGYQDPQSRFRTVMSYQGGTESCPKSCPKIPRFSTPDYTWRGNAIGTEQNDNSLKLNENWSQVSKFRLSAEQQQQGGSTPTPEPGTPPPPRLCSTEEKTTCRDDCFELQSCGEDEDCKKSCRRSCCRDGLTGTIIRGLFDTAKNVTTLCLSSALEDPNVAAFCDEVYEDI